MEDQILYISNGLKALLIFSTIIATFLGVTRMKKIGFYSIFTILTFSAFAQIIISSTLVALSNGNRNLPVINHSINFYLLLELVIITYFFYHQIKLITLKRIILVINGIFLTLLLFSSINNFNFITENYSSIVAIEAIIVLTECIFLFIQTLNDDSNLPLMQSPDFILTSGIFFFFSFTCPYYVLNFFHENGHNNIYDHLFIINDLGYIALNYSIIKAFKCKIHSNILLSC